MGDPLSARRFGDQASVSDSPTAGGVRINGSDIRLPGLEVRGTGQGSSLRRQTEALDHQSLAVLEQGMTLLRRYPRVSAGVLVFLAASVVTSSAVLVVTFALPWLLFVLPALVGLAFSGAAVGLLLAPAVDKKHKVDPSLEKHLLRLALNSGGQLTVTGAALALGAPLADVDAAIASLQRSGHISTEYDAETGMPVYVFPEVQAGLVGVADGKRRSLL